MAISQHLFADKTNKLVTEQTARNDTRHDQRQMSNGTHYSTDGYYAHRVGGFDSICWSTASGGFVWLFSVVGSAFVSLSNVNSSL